MSVAEQKVTVANELHQRDARGELTVGPEQRERKMGDGGQCRGRPRWGADASGRKRSPSGQTDVTTAPPERHARTRRPTPGGVCSVVTSQEGLYG